MFLNKLNTYVMIVALVFALLFIGSCVYGNVKVSNMKEKVDEQINKSLSVLKGLEEQQEELKTLQEENKALERYVTR